MEGYSKPIPDMVIDRLPDLIRSVDGDVSHVGGLESFPATDMGDAEGGVLFGFRVTADVKNVTPKDGRKNKYRIGRETEFVLTPDGRVVDKTTRLWQIGEGHIEGIPTIEEAVYEEAKAVITRKELEEAGLI